MFGALTLIDSYDCAFLCAEHCPNHPLHSPSHPCPPKQPCKVKQVQCHELMLAHQCPSSGFDHAGPTVSRSLPLDGALGIARLTAGCLLSNYEDTPAYEDTPDNEAVHQAVHWAMSPPVTTEKTSKQAIDLREEDSD